MPASPMTPGSSRASGVDRRARLSCATRSSSGDTRLAQVVRTPRPRAEQKPHTAIRCNLVKPPLKATGMLVGPGTGLGAGAGIAMSAQACHPCRGDRCSRLHRQAPRGVYSRDKCQHAGLPVEATRGVSGAQNRVESACGTTSATPPLWTRCVALSQPERHTSYAIDSVCSRHVKGSGSGAGCESQVAAVAAAFPQSHHRSHAPSGALENAKIGNVPVVRFPSCPKVLLASGRARAVQLCVANFV